MIDLISGVMTLLAGLVAFLLVFAIIDHWILSLSSWSRWLAFMSLMGAAGWFVAFQIVPLLMRPINPVYAAKAIEAAEPSLKNSLINFLMFRQDPQTVHQVVYSALEQRAATDLSHVTIDNAVDRSKLIYVGYGLASVLAIGAAYKILSPKDPFQSASRVAAPWADIERPSRVRIDDVTPGDAQVFQGESVAVSAVVHGEADAVQLFYSTADGELVDQLIEMKLDPSSLRYEAMLPDSGEGLQREVLYRIEAGDAVTASYRLRVSPAPNIVVEQLQYDYPSYTGRPRETLVGQGDVTALEGTRVTIRAKANQPIRSAYIELESVAASLRDASSSSGRQEESPLRSDGTTRRIPLKADGLTASGEILLELQPDRKTPLHAAYQVRFSTESGRENAQPILHTIDVIPDLAPEVEILTPNKEATEVPADGVQKIEIRALDPDFGLTKLALRAVTGGDELVNENLFADQAGAGGQTVRTFAFRPADYELQVGARVTYRATAEDNRTEVGGESPHPNSARTKDYQLLIVPPLKSESAGESSAKPEEDPSAEPKDDSSTGKSEQPNDSRPNDSEDPGESDTNTDDKNNEGEPNESEKSKDAESGESGTESDAGEEQEGATGSEQQEGASGETSEGAGGEGKQQEGAAGASDADGKSKPGQTNGGTPGGDTPQQGGKPGQSGGAGEQRTEELHDGEVFEKALERIKQQQQESGKTGAGEPASGDPNQQTEEGGQDSSTNSGNKGSASGGSSGESGESSDSDKLPNGDEKDSSKQEADPQQQGEGPKHEDNNLGAGAQKQAAPGEGGSSKKDDRPTGNNGAEADTGEKDDPKGPKDNRKKDPGSGASGDSRAGQNSEDTTGTGSVEQAKDEQVQNRDKPKEQNPDSTEQQKKSDSAAATSKRQSDSEGNDSGDMSGGGKKGGGQGANQSGNDSAGQNSASDEGAGKATEAGNGETSDTAGQKQKAAGETGSAGKEKGHGSSGRQDPSGDTTADGETTSQPESGETSEQQPQEGESESSKGGLKPGGTGVPSGGGLPSDNDTPSGLDPNAEVAPGDEANLDYARKTTEMVLDYLKDQKDEPDSELLDKLGWTQEELNAFLKRWQQLKRAAAEDKAGERELDESLRSLGLRPSRDRSRTGGTKTDDVRGLRDSGSQSAPPRGYQKLFDAFKKGAARSK